MTVDQWQDFKMFFATKHPDIDKKLPSKSLINGEPFITQPATMTNDDYAEYNKILDNWRMENNAL